MGSRPGVGEQVGERTRRRQRDDLDDEPSKRTRRIRRPGPGVHGGYRIRGCCGARVRTGDDPVDDPADGPDGREFLDNLVDQAAAFGKAGPSLSGGAQADPLRQRSQNLSPLDRIDAQIGLEIQVRFQHLGRITRRGHDHLHHRAQQHVRIPGYRPRRRRRDPGVIVTGGPAR